MKSLLSIALALTSMTAAHAADDAASAPAAAQAPPPAASMSANEAARMAKMRPELEGYCLYGSKPTGTAKYTVLAPVKSGRQTYGSVLDELPRFVDEARAAGGDAVIGFNAGQHFGFWPWRLVRPVVSGTPIKWDGPAPDCAVSGGKTFGEVMVTNKEPPKK